MEKKRINNVRSGTRRTKVNNICKDLDSPIKEQIETLTKAIIVLQEKLENNLEDYINEPLYQEIVDREGNEKKISNPFVAEFRATLKEYANDLEQLKKLLEIKTEENEEINELDTIINKIRVVK